MFQCMLFIGLCATLIAAQYPPPPRDASVQGTKFLDHDSALSTLAGKSFLRENIPFIDIPDKTIEDVYYYRWSALHRHLKYSTPEIGYVITEFVQPVGYTDPNSFGAIDAAAGHQLQEARWLRSTYFAEDYIRLWASGTGNSHQYTHWIQDAALSVAQVTGNSTFLASQLQGMVNMWHAWDDVFDSKTGLYYYLPTNDAQEYSLPGWIAAASNNDDGLRFTGPETYRPSHNAYMVANARAIAATAKLSGNSATEQEFTQYANQLQQAMLKTLWSTSQKFFVDVIRPDNPNLSQVSGREEVGFFPYRFGIGLSKQYAQSAVDALFDKTAFLTAYGPPTLEVYNQYYSAQKPSDYCCFWNGQSWPFSTAHILKSVATIRRSGVTTISSEQYVQLLKTYATTQYKDGNPYVAESHSPTLDVWTADTTNHSEHYAHSTYVDDVITGLLGVLPSFDESLQIDPLVPSTWNYFALENLPYHGHLLTMLYDSDGSRYNQGKGMSVFIDGKRVYNGAAKKMTVNIGQIANLESPRAVNIASNPTGINNRLTWPRASATCSYRLDDAFKAIDGTVYYDSTPDNRWSNYNCGRANETLSIHLEKPRQMTGIVLAIFEDLARGGQCACPTRILITDGKGRVITDVQDFKCASNDKNTIKYPKAVTSDTINLNFYPQAGKAVAVAEVEIWV